MNLERSGAAGEPRSHRSYPDLAWQPDLLETFGVANSIGRLEHFHPVEPNPEATFITAMPIVPHVLSGGRGAGKSTLLYFRARFLLQQKDIAFVREVPPNGFLLKAHSIPIPRDALVLYSNVEAWTKAWKLVLSLLFAHSIKRAIDAIQPALGKELGAALAGTGIDLLHKLSERLHDWAANPHGRCVEDLVRDVLDARPRKEMLESIHDRIDSVLRRRIVLTQYKTWFLFVDRIDEALAAHKEDLPLLSFEADRYVDNDQVTAGNVEDLVHEVWKSAQAGYAIASYELRTDSNGQLVAMGTIRAETYKSFIDKFGQIMKPKIGKFVLDLGGDGKRKDELMRGIFGLNVSMMGSHDLCRTVTRDYDEHVDGNLELFGYQQLYSRAVVGYSETPYDFLRRHSFGTPRGLMQLGGAAATVGISHWPGMDKKVWRSPTQVIEAVNKAAVDVYEEYRGSLFPRWDIDYDTAFSYLRSNVISHEELFRNGGVVDLFRKHFKERDKDALTLVEYLFSVGLLGVPMQSSQSRTGWIQGFSDPDQAKVCPSKFAYALLHPAFSAWLTAKIPRDAAAVFYNSQLVVCPGAPCPEVMPQPLLRLSFRQSENSAFVRASVARGKEWVDLFPTVNGVGTAFICVLAVAHRFEGGGHLKADQLLQVAVRLARLKYIPSRLGKTTSQGPVPRKSPEEWIKELCDSVSDPESHSLQSGRSRLLQGESPGLTIDVEEFDDGRRFCLYLRHGSVARPLEREEILIEGLSIDEWFKAQPSMDPD